MGAWWRRVRGGLEGGKRRRRLLVAAVASVVALGAVMISNALAVHDIGLFELDRNATDDALVDGDDWDTPPVPTGDAELFTGIKSDTTAPGNQFQGGGSKDNNDITQWLWKEGEPLDKDDITNAYAAGYTIPEGAVEEDDENDVGDFVIYFGLDRLANNGSAQVGFWFFKNQISAPKDTPRGGGFEFVGEHEVGDILVQSNFSQGGTISSVSVFEWVGSGGSHGSLNLLEAAGDCITPTGDPAPDDDAACATANQEDEDAPWDYTPKFGTAGTFPQGSFFEGGVNVTRLLQESGEPSPTACFSTFGAETRSSTPFDSRLKDFTLDEFETCGVDVDTLADPTTDNVVPGTAVKDTATVTGTSLVGGTAPRPTGTVKFFLCQPTEVITNGGDCSAGGTLVDQGGDEPNGETLVEKTSTPATNDSTATSDETTNTTALGKYCWRAEYVPALDSPYTAESFTDTDDECFTTVAQQTDTTTRQFVFPQDRAKITAPAATGDLDGNVHFRLFDTKAHCDAFDASGATTGLVFNSGAIAVDGASPQERKTNNTTYAIDSDKTTTHFWHVIYDADPDGARGNAAQLDSKSNCVESTAVTFGGPEPTDPPITVPGD